MYKALRISPMIPSFNMKETAAFFIDILGFSKYMYEEGYIILYKEEVSVHILNAGDIGEMEFYLEVDDVDAIWESKKDQLSGINVRAPFDREYGMREMHIIIPQTKTLLFIGQAIK
jgi:hypothetical protein